MKPEAMEQFFTSMAAAHAHQSAAAEALTLAFKSIYGERITGDVAPVIQVADIKAAERAMVAEAKAKPKAPKPQPQPEAPAPVAEAETPEPQPEAPAPVEAPAAPKAEAPKAEPVGALDIADVRKKLLDVQAKFAAGGDIKDGRAACLTILKEHADGQIALPKVPAKFYPAIVAACDAALAQGAA